VSKDEQKRDVQTFQQNYRKKTATGDGIHVFQHNPETECHSFQWISPESLRVKKAVSQTFYLQVFIYSWQCSHRKRPYF
jgi:hypothetical protein